MIDVRSTALTVAGAAAGGRRGDRRSTRCTFVLTGGEDHALVGTFEPADVPDGWTVIGTRLPTAMKTRPAGTVTVDGELYTAVTGHAHFRS